MQGIVKVNVLFYRGDTAMDAVIRWQTRSAFAHVAIEMPDGVVYESLPRKGVHRHVGAYPGVTETLYCALSDSTYLRLRQELDAMVGDRYDYLGVVRFITRRAASETDGKEFCSDVIALAFQRAGIPLLARVESWKLAPGHLYCSPLLHKEVPDHPGRYAAAS